MNKKEEKTKSFTVIAAMKLKEKKFGFFLYVCIMNINIHKISVSVILLNYH